MQLSDLQLAVMRVIWRDGEATVAKVHQELLPSRGLATTTVATVLTRLEKRGVLTHRREGRQFIYRTLITEEEARRHMVAELADRVFQGDAADLVATLIAERPLGEGEKQRVCDALKESSEKN
jgi:predicted transcriptional regulator